MFIKLKLFFISLLPLYLIFIIQNINLDIYQQHANVLLPLNVIIFENNLPTFILLCFIIISILFYLQFRYFIKGGQKNPIEIISISNINYEHLVFFVTYLIPFIAFDLKTIRSCVVVILLILIICIIFVKTNLFYANPTLAIFGFHIYRLDTLEKKDIIVITLNKLKKGDQIYNKKIAENIFFGNLSL